MPKLPDVTALGGRPTPRVSRIVPSGGESFARGADIAAAGAGQAGAGLTDLGGSLQRASELIALGEERISARRDSIERLRVIETFNQEGNDELLRLSTEEDMASEAVAAKYRTFLDSKRASVLEGHAGRPDSRVRLAERLQGVHGELLGRAVAMSFAAQEKLVTETIGRYINSSVTHAYDPSTTIDDLFTFYDGVVDDIESLSERERQVFKRVGHEQIAEAKISSLLMRGASAEAEELLTTLDVPEVLGPGVQEKLRAQIVQFDNSVMNAFLEGQAERAKLESLLGRPATDIELSRKAGVDEPTPGVSVNIGPTGIDYGEPEAGLAWTRNPDGTVRLDERGAPIAVAYQGGSVAREGAAAEEKAETVKAQRGIYADVVTQDIDRAVKIVDTATIPVTGFGSYLAAVPGTDARDVQALVDTIKANVGFDRLQSMRAASTTGSALGPVSDFENRMLQATIGNLELSQSKPQFVENLKRVKEIYLDIVHGPGNRPVTPMDFSALGIDEIAAINLADLSDDERMALDKRLRELGFE